MKNLTMQVPEEKWEQYKKVAKDRNISLAELMKEGTDMLATFNPDFLDQIGKVSAITNLSPAIVIQQLLCAFMAQETAIRETFGISKIFNRAFRFDETGLVTGEMLIGQVTSEVKDEAEQFLNKLMAASSGDKKTFTIERSEAALWAATL